ncbi:monothiol glutaredoxin grx5 [Pleurotus ostreatus]|uniref:Monothiol glutaredoxin-5, mitochondrial n=1 Tax=Pleurotus ostreatus TaxID=5322 RepID=A0A8H7A116_PLEOS|nr:monothiol glutaredoxin grx5 [Pleurotus ostreatus]KAF7430796.1 monothiol glutaredoxin grx5 [Pleurotus ostreatus]KAJ8695152.1 monothiol glutaredoxin grx5 [Pleurotus ostreatus]
MFRASINSSFGLLRPTLRTSLTPSRLQSLRFLSQETRAQLETAVKSSPVVLFMKGTPAAPQCGFSRAVVQILDMHGVPPEKLKTFNVLEDEELRSGIKEFSEWPTVPQVYVNGEFVGGCDILLGMHQSGELETLLVKGDVVEATPEPEPAATTGTSS